MKTAVSVPDDVFDAAEALARRSHVSRSELYTTALRALLSRDDALTQALNRVYDGVAPDAAVSSAARRTFSRSEW